MMELIEIKETNDFKLFLKQLKRYQQTAIFPYLKEKKEELISYFSSETFESYLKELWQERRFQQEPLRFYFFEENQKPVGFVLYRFFPYRNYLGWIYDFYIFPEFQHQGKGKMALETLEDYLFKHQVETIQCTCIPPWSCDFFQHEGYHYCASTKENYLIFEKNITN